MAIGLAWRRHASNTAELTLRPPIGYCQAPIKHIYGVLKVETKRTPVSLTADERAEIERAMVTYGIRSMSDFLRWAALFMARKDAGQ